jgi:hypothetical protein
VFWPNAGGAEVAGVPKAKPKPIAAKEIELMNHAIDIHIRNAN